MTNKRHLKIGILSLMFIILVANISACEKKESKKENKIETKSENEIYIYYVNEKRTKLVSTTYAPDGQDAQSKAVNTIEQLNTMPTVSDAYVAKTEEIQVIGQTIKDNVFYMNFASSYYEMNKVEELLYRAAVVKSLTQLEGIDAVVFQVVGEDLVLNGKYIGEMTEDMFVDNSIYGINSFENSQVLLYFANKGGNTLVPVKVSKTFEKTTSMEQRVIETLIKGPESTEYRRTVPEKLRLISVHTEDGICYVDFDDSFITEAVNVVAEIELYSIVNSLIELGNVNKVQISVNGNSDVNFRDEISLEYPFTRNVDIVIK